MLQKTLNPTSMHMTPLDSDSIADYLLDHPHFFEEHAELLGRIRLTSPLLGRAISLQERQMEILREKIKVQELHMADLMRIAQENDEITSKFQSWTRSLLLARNDNDLPQTLSGNLQAIFNVPKSPCASGTSLKNTMEIGSPRRYRKMRVFSPMA